MLLQCQYWRFWATDPLSQVGWVFSESKMRDPSQLPIFLGFLVDTVKLTFHLPQEKLDNLVSSMEEILSQRRVMARGLASMVGKLMAAYRALGKNLVGLMTRDCYRVINSIGYTTSPSPVGPGESWTGGYSISSSSVTRGERCSL